MTRKRFTRILIATPVLLSATSAQAHPGGHDGLAGVSDVFAHLAGSPFHLLLAVGAVVVGALAARVLYKWSVTRS